MHAVHTLYGCRVFVPFRCFDSVRKISQNNTFLARFQLVQQSNKNETRKWWLNVEREKNERKLCGNNECHIMNDVRHAVCLLFITFFHSFCSYFPASFFLERWMGRFFQFLIHRFRYFVDNMPVLCHTIEPLFVGSFARQSGDKHAIFDHLVKSIKKPRNKITTATKQHSRSN